MLSGVSGTGCDVERAGHDWIGDGGVAGGLRSTQT